MSNRTASENSDAVGLFPFLAVLLCTMGALLVLLVVLAQRVGERPAAKSDASVTSQVGINESEVPEAPNTSQLQRKLEEIREYQEQLARLRTQGLETLEHEKDRLTHLEEHTRRLEHELGMLSATAEKLKQTEEDQQVDQEQAEREMSRLEGLIQQTVEQVEKLREENSGKHSYAIVPYKGSNGTFRKPIYIECSGGGITIRPEGVEFSQSDLAVSSWPGNPLAAALRASREHLNSEAAAAGKPAPEPYPVLLVRPSGIKYYALARAAITSWDENYGYEFIEEDWELTFPEMADPRLARIQQHAVLIARERMNHLAQAAPRKFQGVGLGGKRDFDGRGGSRQSGTSSSVNSGGQGRYASGNQAEQISSPGGEGDLGELSSSLGEDQSGEFAPSGSGGRAESQGDATTPTSSDQGGSHTQSPDSTALGNTSNTGNVSSENYGEGSSSGTSQNGSAQSNSSASGQQSTQRTTSQGSPASGGQANAASSPEEQTPTPSWQYSDKDNQSIADAQGRNWAIKQAGRGSVPIRRSIRAVVGAEELTLLPSKVSTGGADSATTVISLDQSLDEVSTAFVKALRERIQEWGLAGNGMFWRPVLVLDVKPTAHLTAKRINQLLQDSGVEVKVPETANSRPMKPVTR